MPKKESRSIVVYSNDLNSRVTLASLSAVETDLFFSILAALRYKRLEREKNGETPDNTNEEVTLTFDQLKKLSNYSQNGDTRFKSYLIKLYQRILSLQFVVESEYSYASFHLFSMFEVNSKDKTVRIVTDPNRRYMLEQLDKNFTIMELRMITDIPITAGKSLARLLSQYRSTGVAIFPIEGDNGIRRQFGVNKDVPMKDITRRIIKPATAAVKKYFPDLTYDYIRENKGSGRKIKAVKFNFKPGKPDYGVEHQDLYKNPPEMKREAQTCPICGGKLYQRFMNGSYAWCHLDGMNEGAKCHAIFNTIAEINGYEEIPTRESIKDNKIKDTAKVKESKGSFDKDQIEKDITEEVNNEQSSDGMEMARRVSEMIRKQKETGDTSLDEIAKNILGM